MRGSFSSLRLIVALSAICAGLLLVAFVLGRASVTGASLVEVADPEPIVVTDEIRLEVLEERLSTTAQVTPEVVVDVPVPDVAIPIITQLDLSLGQMIEAPALLLEVAGRPILVLDGELPAYRSLGPGVLPGPDVAQVEAVLSSMGLLSEGPDSSFDESTAVAVAALYSGFGYSPVSSGTLSIGEVVYLPDGIGTIERMAAERAAILMPGDIQVGIGGLRFEFSASSLQRPRIRPALLVRVSDNTGLLLESTVASVRDLSAEESDSLAVELRDDVSGLSTLDSVLLEFVLASTQTPVLTASPAAIHVTSENSPFVELADGTQIPVKIGLVAMDRVQIVSTDARLAEGVSLTIDSTSS
ncbi:MAG: hypothetical protein ACRDWA_04975 [Acidimicrobiia bacterium]